MMKRILLIFVLVSALGAFFALNSSPFKPGIIPGEPVPIKFEEERREAAVLEIDKIKKEIDSLAKSVKTLTPPPPPPAPPAVRSADIYAKALKAAVTIFCYDRESRVYIMGS